jgi:Raf kinase inhibitor-like YbhB/YbcL family protein
MNWFFPLFLITILISACAAKPAQNGPPAGPGGAPSSTITLTSPAFAQGQPIPAKYTCQGDDSSPAMEWSEPPAGTKSLALIMDDPDAPVGTWVHWVVYNLPPDAARLDEGASKAKAPAFSLPSGAIQGRSSFKRSDYGGPCPPSGMHRYFFRLYALDTLIDKTGLDKAGLLAAMEGHVLATGELMGTYKKQ